MQRPKLFISYAHDDKDSLVDPLVKTLKIAEYEPWYDWNLIPGLNWQDQLLGAIKQCDVFVYAMTSKSLASEWCLWELKQAAELGKPIIPIKLQDNIVLPDELAKIQWVDFSKEPSDQAFARLVAGINAATTIPPEAV